MTSKEEIRAFMEELVIKGFTTLDNDFAICVYSQYSEFYSGWKLYRSCEVAKDPQEGIKYFWVDACFGSIEPIGNLAMVKKTLESCVDPEDDYFSPTLRSNF